MLLNKFMKKILLTVLMLSLFSCQAKFFVCNESFRRVHISEVNCNGVRHRSYLTSSNPECWQSCYSCTCIRMWTADHTFSQEFRVQFDEDLHITLSKDIRGRLVATTELVKNNNRFDDSHILN